MGSLPFSVGWINSLDGTALDGRDVKEEGMEKGFAPGSDKDSPLL
jgi:hypothetical protein